MNHYATVVADFARLGADMIRTDPRSRYEVIGKCAKRKLEPGYIPIDKPPLLTAISYYPNETDLPSPEYAAAEASFHRWGESGAVEDYVAAYRDWLAFRDQVPFYKRWEAPLFQRLEIKSEETAWLPLIKCPLPAGTAVDREGMDLFRDRDWLWQQLQLLRPAVVLVQSTVVDGVVGRSLPNLKSIRAHGVQKIPQFAKGEMKQSQLDELVATLKPVIDERREAHTDI